MRAIRDQAEMFEALAEGFQNPEPLANLRPGSTQRLTKREVTELRLTASKTEIAQWLEVIAAGTAVGTHTLLDTLQEVMNHDGLKSGKPADIIIQQLKLEFDTTQPLPNGYSEGKMFSTRTSWRATILDEK